MRYAYKIITKTLILIQSSHVHPETTKRTCATPDTKNLLTTNHSLNVAEKCVETYSSSNTAARYRYERVK